MAVNVKCGICGRATSAKFSHFTSFDDAVYRTYCGFCGITEFRIPAK